MTDPRHAKSARAVSFASTAAIAATPATPAPARIPAGFDEECETAWRAVRETTGYLTEREAKFLMLAAVATPARGAILEIGSFKGRSTVGLGLVAKRHGLGPIVAVDPFTAPSSTDPDIGAQGSTFEDFQANLRRAGVLGIVEPHRMYSRELAATWSRPLRLLWIDGDHTFEGAREDVRLFKHFLADGAVVAMHDVVSTFPGSTRAFVEEVLESDDFGPVGCCGSIAWAQYRPRDGGAPGFARRRARLAWRMRRLLGVLEQGELRGARALQHRLWRALIPHRAADPARWSATVRAGR